jgi:hypothetical protein
MSYHITWLAAMLLCFSGGGTALIVGGSMLRRVVEDLSNSERPTSYVLRVFRMLPGVALVMFGCYIIFRCTAYVLSLPLPPTT